jgi:ATP-dependent helicase HrpB
LWSEAAHLEPVTPPEIHRESLTPLVLAAAALGTPVPALRDLPFLDPLREDAVATARAELTDLGALDAAGALTERGEHLFGLPLDPALGALLVAARERPEVLRDMVDLVSVLAPGRRLFLPQAHEPQETGELPPTFETACDAVALLTALRGGHPPRHRVDGGTLAEARTVRKRLEEAFGLGDRPPPDAPVDRRRLALAALAADPGRGHVARVRSQGRRVAWSAGGTEILLARESGVQELLAGEVAVPEALVVLDSMAMGSGGREARVLATAAMPVPPSWLAEAGLGEATVAAVDLAKDRSGRPVGMTARVERRYAGRVLGEIEGTPTGDLARQAVARAVLDRRLFSAVRPEAEERLEAARLARLMADRVEGGWLDWTAEVAKLWPDGVPSLEEWVQGRVAELGVASGDDVALLDAADLLPPDLPAVLRDDLDKRFPRRLELPDAVYRLEYEPARRRVILEKVRGHRKVPPPVAFLPRLEGLAIKIRHKEQLLTLRDERGRVVGTSIT